MSSRISIYDKSGQWLTEVNATFNRVYKLNEFGMGTFTLSTDDDKCREDYLQFGNYIYAEHDKLPSWGGMIDTPRQWGHGKVTITAYSGEYILTTRITKRNTTLSGQWGTIFQELIETTIDAPNLNIIKIGSIFGGGKSTKQNYRFESLYEASKKLAKESGQDFDILPVIDDNGRLFFEANWYERKGMQKTFTLYEDHNIELSERLLVEQGRIANQLRVHGEGATQDTKPNQRVTDIESIGKYGARYLFLNARGDDVEASADSLLIEYANPRKTYDINAIDKGDTFYHCRVGDILPVSCYSVGFSGSGFGTAADVRILQMNYNDEKNTLKLVADEVRE